MPHDATVVLGMEVPSTDPLFLAVVGFHVLAGLCCVVSGAIAIFSEKRPGRHPAAGTVYDRSLVAVLASARALSVVR